MSNRTKESFNHLTSTSSSVSSDDSEVLDKDPSDDLNSNRTSSTTGKKSSSRHLSEDEVISQTINILQLDDDSTESKIYSRDLLTNGRQALSKIQKEISPKVYEKEMSKDNSELLTLLKTYVNQQWETTTDEWLQIFIKKKKDESPDLYDQILTRTAEYGSKYFKDNPSLSLVLQFILEFDEFSPENEQIFDDVWTQLTTHGRQALENFSKYIAPNIIKEQRSDDSSPLSLALQAYFREPLSNLLKQIKKSQMLDLFLNCIMKYGWEEGLNQSDVTQNLAPNKLETLKEKSKKYWQPKVLDNSSPTSTTTETSILIEPSLSKSTDQPEPLITMTDPLITNVPHRKEQDEHQKQTHEITLVTMCTERYEKWHLAHLVEAGELVYIYQKFDDVIDKIVQNYRTQQDFSNFMNNCLQSLMYLLKRHQNLNNFIETLFFKYSEVELLLSTPKLNSRMFIDILLLNSDFSLSRMIMSLLSKRNPVPFVQPTLNKSEPYRFVPDIIHVWDYDAPTILSFGIEKCQGKSTLLNTIFMSSFEQSTSSIYFQQTIDIDFGYSFLSRRSINIADTHGVMTEKLFNQIQDLFDGFLIHIQYEYLKNNPKNLRYYLDSISQQNKYYFILIRDVPENLLNQCSNWFDTTFSLSTIQRFSLPNIADQNKTQNKHCILKVRDQILENTPTKRRHEKNYTLTQLKDLFDQKYKDELYEINRIIFPLKEKLIGVLQNENLASEYFVQYMIYAKLCDLKLQLANFNFYGNQNDAIVFEINRKIFEFENQLNNPDQPCGIIFDLFIQILKSPNMLICLDLLSNQLKQERSRLIAQGDMAKQLPIHQSLSLEILWRNAMVCINQQNESVQKILYKKYYEYIRAGYPFEILDGDNFYFHHQFLTEALTFFREKRILVISIIGPQNSGKSTLLNYMFGTLFDVRDGRCTRGIYGSFVKSNCPKFDYIMLIDTEGLLGVERKDPEYDRRIVLFCLAVSHLVIVNMIGEVNTALESMLSLCTDSLKQMGVTRIPQPTVHFILNQKADLNTENNRAAIDNIISGLQNIGPAIDIRRESFHTLPSAFKKESNLTSNSKLPNLIKTEPDFLERVQLLCGELIKSAESVFCRSTEFSDPIQWIKSSFTIFETLQKFSDLTYYHDISERQQDNEIREHIKTKLTEIFSSKYRNQLIEASLKQNENEITEMLVTSQHKIQEIMNQDLENAFKLLKVSDTIRKRSKQFLDVQIIAAFDALKTACTGANEREKIKLLVRDGEGDLRKLIDETIHSGVVMSPKDASEKFELMFTNSVEHIQSRFIPKELLRSALKYIFTNYNIYEKAGLSEFQDISSHLTILNGCIDGQLSMEIIRDQFVLNFTRLAYAQHSPVEVHPFTNDQNNSYSFEQIESLVYLNKKTLEDSFIAYLRNTNPDLSNQQKSKNGFNNSIKSMISPFRNSNSKKKQSSNVQPSIYTADFLRDIRKNIQAQQPQISHGEINEANMILRLSNFIQNVIDVILKEMENSGNNQVRQIQTDLIQKIVGLINTLNINIDNELRPFCLTLSRRLKAVFHICAIGLLTLFYFNERENHFQQNLCELNEKKDELKQYFVKMVVPDASIDSNYATNLLKQFQEHITDSFKSQGQRIINLELQQHDRINRKYIQNICDDKILLNTNMTWLMNYIEQPTTIIEQQFNQLWKNILEGINRKLIETKTEYYSIFTEFFFCLEGVKEAIKKIPCSATTFIQEVFQPEDNNSLNINENYTHKKRCMAFLVYYYLSGEEIPPTIIIKSTKSENYQLNTYKLKTNIFDSFQLLAKQRPPSAKLQIITKEMLTVYDRTSIDNLPAFLQYILNEKTNFLNAYNQINCDFDSIDKQGTYVHLLDKIRGCPNLCPCCKRPCDVDHTQIKSCSGSKYNEHRCTTGHALRAMNGYKFEVTGEASLMMCEQIKDDQILVIGSQRMKWSEFKSNHSDWNFESTIDDNELRRLHGKFLNLWTKIGPHLCQKYNMKYVVFNTAKQNVVTHESFHWILVLDGSGSMAGKPWKDLLQAVVEFINHRTTLNTTDRITIIIFSDKAIYACFNEEIKNIKVDEIPFPSGGTDFNGPFMLVNECIKRFETSNTNTMKHAIIFMTDGDAEYPDNPLNELFNEHGANIRFWTLALGSEINEHAKLVLEQINHKMNGSYYTLAVSSELSQTFAEIATNINNTNNHSD